MQRVVEDELGRVGPQPVEPVVAPLVLAEDMHDDVAVVDDDPAGLLAALTPDGTAGGVLELPLDLLGERAELTLAASGDEDEVVGDAEEVADVDGAKVATLLLDGGGDGGADGGLGLAAVDGAQGSCSRSVWWPAAGPTTGGRGNPPRGAAR